MLVCFSEGPNRFRHVKQNSNTNPERRSRNEGLAENHRDVEQNQSLFPALIARFPPLSEIL